ncbi:hypothetical protein [Streptomyces sp. NPDC002851]
MSGTSREGEMGARAARARALAVLRVRSRALAVALLPAAVAVVLLVGGATGRISGGSWGIASWSGTVVAALVLLAAAGVALVVGRARPAVSPTVPIAEDSAPDLYGLVRDLADRLDVPAPSAIALTPDCDSWLEDRTHPAHGPPAPRPARTEGSDPAVAPHPAAGSAESAGAQDLVAPIEPVEPAESVEPAEPAESVGPAEAVGPDEPAGADGRAAPVLVIGSPFLWWMRVGELRAVLAPVVAGTGPSAHPDIAAARRFVRGLDAAVAVSARPGRGPVPRAVLAGVGWLARLLLRACRGHAAEMERGVAAAAAERAQAVDYGLRIVAQEQVGLAYAGWDRLLTRVALPAWRMGRWPSRLDAGVVAALTELSRRDRLAEGFASRLGERPACDLLEEPGAVDEAASLLAARLFHGGPAEPGPDWSPVGWQEYPEEVVDRKWRSEAARLHRVLDELGVRTAAAPGGEPEPPTLSRVMEHLEHAEGPSSPGRPKPVGPEVGPVGPVEPVAPVERVAPFGPVGPSPATRTSSRTKNGTATRTENDTTVRTESFGTEAIPNGPTANEPIPNGPARADDRADDRTEALAARLSAEVEREEAVPAPVPMAAGAGPDDALWEDGLLPLFPLQPSRSGRELLADHITAMVCCAAVDTAGAAPGLDWLDGPTLLVDGDRVTDLAPRVLSLVEDADPEPLRAWLTTLGVRPEKPVRLV